MSTTKTENLLLLLLPHYLNLTHVFIQSLLKLFQEPIDFVLRNAAILLQSVNFFLDLLPDLSGHHPPTLNLLMQKFHKVVPSLSRQRRDIYPNDVATDIGR